MKKIKFILVLMLSTLAISAQEKKNRKSNYNNHKMRVAKMVDFSPEQIATLQTKKMILALDLNDSQQTEIHKLNLKNAELRKEKMKAQKAKRENKEHTKLSSNDRYEIINKRLDHQIQQKQRMKKILSEEQFLKWEKMSKKRAHSQKNRTKGKKLAMMKKKRRTH